MILVVLYPLLGGVYHWGLLLYPVALGLYILFIWGLALALSVLNVEFRDIKHLVEIAVMFLFWLTPVGYDLNTLKGVSHTVVSINPLTSYMQLFHIILYNGKIPDDKTFLVATLWTFGSVALGAYLFRKKAFRLVEDL